MTWRLEWTETAFRALARLDATVAKRLVAKLDEAVQDLPRHFVRLVGRDERKLRVGDHRVLAVLGHESRTVLVLHVGHRSTVYDR